MSLRAIQLFDRTGRPTLFHIRQWQQRSPQQPLRNLPYLNGDKTAAPAFLRLWKAAFPLRQDLPVNPLANADGTGTDAYWRVFV